MGRLVAYDLHTHPLVHKYYLAGREYQLCDEDMHNIRAMIDFEMNRGVEILSLSDHDGIQSSVWAREYVRQRALPIKIVIGAEVSAYEDDYGDIHIGAYGIRENIRFAMDVRRTVNMIHDLGGVAILNHPRCITDYDGIHDDSFVDKFLCYFDGIEVYNHNQEAAEASAQRALAMQNGLSYEEALQMALPGAGWYTSPIMDKYPDLARLQGSDNHGSFTAFTKFFPFTPDKMDEDWFIRHHLI